MDVDTLIYDSNLLKQIMIELSLWGLNFGTDHVLNRLTWIAKSLPVSSWQFYIILWTVILIHDLFRSMCAWKSPKYLSTSFHFLSTSWSCPDGQDKPVRMNAYLFGISISKYFLTMHSSWFQACWLNVECFYRFSNMVWHLIGQ